MRSASLGGHNWPTPVRVRIGLHTGTAAIDEDGYVGVDVHRAFRIASAGHGGQILTSETCAAELTPERDLRDLGLWSLPELPEPERIFQLDEPGLGGSFPPLRARPGGTPVRVVLAEDSVLLREGIARLLEDAGFDVVAQSGNADDLMRHVAMHRPDVAVVDIRMPPTQTDEGLRAAKEIREHHTGTGVLVLSQYVEPGYAMELLSDSAESVGYLLKDRVADVEEFAAAVRRVAEGGSALDPAVVSELVGRHRRDDPIDDLSPREREVLELMAEGRSNQAIAERLFVTLRAVEKHVTSIFVKLRLPGRARGPPARARRARAAPRLEAPSGLRGRKGHVILFADGARRRERHVDQVARERVVDALREEQRRVSPAVNRQQPRARQQVRDGHGALVTRRRIERVADDEHGVRRGAGERAGVAVGVRERPGGADAS